MLKLSKYFLITTLLTVNVYGDIEKSPTEMYSMRQLMTNKVMVDIKIVKDIRKACEKESRTRGLGGFRYSMTACSFWTELLGHFTCTILINEDTNNDILGHEIHHCFVGHFH